jgi:hypothetical protein
MPVQRLHPCESFYFDNNLFLKKSGQPFLLSETYEDVGVLFVGEVTMGFARIARIQPKGAKRLPTGAGE